MPTLPPYCKSFPLLTERLVVRLGALRARTPQHTPINASMQVNPCLLEIRWKFVGVLLPFSWRFAAPWMYAPAYWWDVSSLRILDAWHPAVSDCTSLMSRGNTYVPPMPLFQDPQTGQFSALVGGSYFLCVSLNVPVSSLPKSQPHRRGTCPPLLQTLLLG